ncbi:zn-dependent hydrolase of beta-lactamase fold family protein [Halogeometricum pallidum JCM 14848]|uniref:Zn-dependent hydrolase of beta-lactamase fold family protein n=1 Tax=Halogeometricum pallidum JCM 14848 TaxID=1227487 RepID=M0DJ34_HALPD|nr:MBL fold hydrolase [Halogeometricum pallidum]ELZ34179.1 zn-dependent hydrolase of beta-lactamase fold family protein [Halogeometricum pallidum JCM 14848]
MTVSFRDLRVSWLGYATVRIESESGFVVYLDPGRYGVLDDYYARDGDLVCVTHDHHYDPDAIRSVAKEDATVVVFEGVNPANIDRDVEAVEDLPYEVIRVGEEEHLSVGSVDLWTLPAYNEEDSPHARDDGSLVHPRGLGCAYLLSVDGVTVFWPGDSDVLEGFERLSVDLFLANIGGSVVMDRHEAADLAEVLSPELVLPIHYDTIDLLKTDPEAFVADVASRGIPVVLEDPADHAV